MVLTGVREDQIETCLSALSLDEIDILIKYVYKGLGMPRNNGPLFKWHAKVCGSAVNLLMMILQQAGCARRESTLACPLACCCSSFETLLLTYQYVRYVCY